jgi:hypothetical protein
MPRSLKGVRVAIILATFAAFFSPILASQPPDDSSKRISQEELDAWVSKWQQKLSFQGWQITASFMREATLGSGRLGRSHWDYNGKFATIWILDPRDYKNDSLREIRIDAEYTVLHELIHIALSPLSQNGGTEVETEKVVNKVGDALFFQEVDGKPYSVWSRDKNKERAARTK